MVGYASSAAVHYRNDILLLKGFVKRFAKLSTLQHYHSENLDVHAMSTVYKLCATVLNYHSR